MRVVTRSNSRSYTRPRLSIKAAQFRRCRQAHEGIIFFFIVSYDHRNVEVVLSVLKRIPFLPLVLNHLAGMYTPHFVT